MQHQNTLSWLILVFAFFALSQAAAQTLPTIPGPINYDPVGSSTLVISRGGSSVRITDSTSGGIVPSGNLGSVPLGGDDNDLPTAPWNWEVLISNLTPLSIEVPVVLSLPGRRALTGTLKVDPPSATSSGTAYFNLVIDEGLTGIFGGADTTTGNFYVTLTPPKSGTYEPVWIGFDTSIVEEIGNVELRSSKFTERPGPGFPFADALTIVLNFDQIGNNNLSNPVGNMGIAFNGLTPSASSIDHLIPVSPNGPLSLELSSFVPQQKFILLGDTGATGGSINLPWGGTLDLANPSILLNGIQPLSFFDSMAVSNFNLSMTIDCTQMGTSWPALQAIYQESSMPPLFLNHTEVGRAYFPTTVKTYYHDLTDDGFVQHDLCGSLDYLGVNYTSLYICANGQITFDHGVTGFAPSSVDFFGGFQPQGGSANPGVAPIWTDLNNSQTTGDWILVTENTVTGSTRVQFKNQAHWTSLTDAGSWSCKFGSLSPNSVVFDVGGYLPGVANSDDDPISGVTDGNNTPIGTGTNSIVDFSSITNVPAGAYQTQPGAEPESIMEQFALAGMDPMAPFDLSVLSFTDVTGTGLWTIF